jgi:dTDP-4-amino-4,6-dideoxygalactose transaminase
MLEMQAVLGRIQLRRMEGWTAARNANARRVRAALEPLSSPTGPVRLPPFVTSRGDTHAYYRYYCYVRPGNLAEGWDRDRIVAEINAADVPCLQGSCSEVYLEKAFEDAGLRPARRLPVAMELGETSLAFLVHPTLTKDEVDKTAETAAAVLRSAAASA